MEQQKNGIAVQIAKRILQWSLVAFLAIYALVFMPSVGSVFLLLGVILVLPVKKVQGLWQRILPQKWLKALVVAGAVVIGMVTVPNASTETNVPNQPNEPTSSVVAESTVSQETTSSLLESTVSSKAETSTSSEVDSKPGTIVSSTEVSSVPEKLPEQSRLTVHFIDVGQADAALIECDGKYMLIDGGNAADSSLIYSYLQHNAIQHLDYIIATHPHEDHIGGLSGALNYATVGIAYSPVAEYDSDVFADFLKYLNKQGKTVTVPKAGQSFSLGSATVTILGPITVNRDDPNNASIVLRIVHGENSFLFTGDAEREEEETLLNAGYMLESTVLKVGHHGSENSTTYPFLREIMPKYAVISVGNKNSYGHPTEEALSRLRDAGVKVYRTDMQGTILCESDGKNVKVTVSKNANADTLTNPTSKPVSSATSSKPTVSQPVSSSVTSKPATTSSAVVSKPVTSKVESKPTTPVAPPVTSQPTQNEVTYILNINPDSLKFHYPSCASVKKMKESNKREFTGTREEAIQLGYTPCGNCHP